MIRNAAAATTASAAVVLAALSPVASAAEPTPDPSGSYAPEDAVTANWTREQALEIQQDETNTKPRIPEDFPIMTNEVWIWDTWPLTNQDMKPVTYKGWHIIFSLTAPRNIAFGDRHWVSRIGYFYSRDGQDWTYGGDAVPRRLVARRPRVGRLDPDHRGQPARGVLHRVRRTTAPPTRTTRCSVSPTPAVRSAPTRTA